MPQSRIKEQGGTSEDEVMSWGEGVDTGQWSELGDILEEMVFKLMLCPEDQTESSTSL